MDLICEFVNPEAVVRLKPKLKKQRDASAGRLGAVHRRVASLHANLKLGQRRGMRVLATPSGEQYAK